MSRTVLKYVSALFVPAFFAAAVWSTAALSANPEPVTRKSVLRLNNNADLFLRGNYDILHMIKIRELGKIGQAAKIATQRKLAGGRIVSHIGTPHIMYAGACAEDVPGNPNIAPDYKTSDPRFKVPEDLGKGDFLIIATPGNQEYRKKGCFLLGLAFPMPTNRYSPPNYNDNPDTPMETQVDMMIYDWAPKEDGLITPSLTPHLKVCPTSPVTVVEYWTLMAQLAHNLALKDTSGGFTASAAWLDTLMGRLDVFHERNLYEVNVAGQRIADKILGGGKLYPWSIRNEFYNEATGTAGGLMGTYPLKPDSLNARDVVILAFGGATPEQEMEMARKVRARGAFLVGIYPFKREDGISTAPLKKLCDMSFDNLSGDSDGVLSIPGYQRKIIPTTGMMNNYIFWAIVGAYIQSMESRGVTPYYWMSFHVPGGKAYDDSIRPYYLKRGY
ncbi:MAG: DUF2529 family protein [Candidatus Latescibacter sp.]|nr:DUF2529 family protein [Candidatus Latescibacter sp.]